MTTSTEVMDDTGKWIPQKMLAGHLAMWAVRQSPYSSPEALADVLEIFQVRCKARMELDEAQRQQCFHHTNYQPLLSLDNKHKAGRKNWSVP